MPSTWECEARICSISVDPSWQADDEDRVTIRGSEPLTVGEELPRAHFDLQPRIVLDDLRAIVAL